MYCRLLCGSLNKDFDLDDKIEAKQNWNLMRMKLYFPGMYSNERFQAAIIQEFYYWSVNLKTESVIKAGIYSVFAMVPVIFNSYVLRMIKETNYRIFFNFYYIILFITNSFR